MPLCLMVLTPLKILVHCQPFGVLAVQLAISWGVKVFTTTRDEEEAQLLRTMSLDVERTLEGHQFMKNSIMDESGGLGIDCIVDNGGGMFSKTDFCYLDKVRLW